MAFSPDGHLMAIYGSSIDLWNITDTLAPLQVGTYPDPESEDTPPVAFSPDGKLLAIGGGNHNTLLLDVTDPARPVPAGPTLDGHTGTIEAVTFLPGTHLIATASADDTTMVWDIASLSHPVRIATLVGHTSDVTALAATPDGKMLATGSFDSTVTVWDMTDPADPRQIGAALPQPTGVSGLAFSPDGDTLASAGQDATSVLLWNIGPSTIRPEQLGAPLSAQGAAAPKVAISPNGRMLATSGPSNDTRLWDISDPAAPRMITDLALPEDDVAFSPDGNLLAVVSDQENDGVSLFDVSDPAHPVPISVPRNPGVGYSVAFAPDGRSFAVGTDGELLIWSSPGRIGAGTPLTVSSANFPHQYTQQNSNLFDQPPVNPLPTVAYSPDSRILAVGTTYTGVTLWNVADPARPLTLGSPLTSQNAAAYAAFSADGSILAVGGGDGQTVMWDVAYPQQPMPIGDPLGSSSNGLVTSVAFSNDGILAIDSDYKAMRLWDESALAAAAANAIKLACDEAGPLSQAAWRYYLPSIPYVQPCQAPASRPAPAQSPSATSSPSPAPTGSAAQLPPYQRIAAQALAKMLKTVMNEQRTVATAVSDVKSCSDLPRAVTILGNATSFMQAYPGGVASIPYGWALPSEMLLDISDVWGAEQQQYAALTTWASNEEKSVSGCSRDYAANTYYQLATQPDSDETLEKHLFVSSWNPLAIQWRLPTYQWDQL